MCVVVGHPYSSATYCDEAVCGELIARPGGTAAVLSTSGLAQRSIPARPLGGRSRSTPALLSLQCARGVCGSTVWVPFVGYSTVRQFAVN